MAADGRLVKFEASVSDRPGGIAKLTALLAECGVSIKDIHHERAWVANDAWAVNIKVVVEAPTRAAGDAMFALLAEKGYAVTSAPKQ